MYVVLYCTLYSVHDVRTKFLRLIALYFVQCSMYIIHFALKKYDVKCTFNTNYNVKPTTYNVQKLIKTLIIVFLYLLDMLRRSTFTL